MKVVSPSDVSVVDLPVIASATLFPIEPYEGLFLVFPANMNHFVPTFWTDDERISVAGNFVVV